MNKKLGKWNLLFLNCLIRIIVKTLYVVVRQEVTRLNLNRQLSPSVFLSPLTACATMVRAKLTLELTFQNYVCKVLSIY